MEKDRDIPPKPAELDWVTDEDWALIPNLYHWQQTGYGLISNARQRSVTPEEALRQQKVLRGEASALEKDLHGLSLQYSRDYRKILDKHLPPVDLKEEMKHVRSLVWSRDEALWEPVRLTPIDNFGKATKLLLEKLSKPHVDNKGNGVQIHRYKIEGVDNIESFIEKNSFSAGSFINNVILHRDLADYRQDLMIEENKLKGTKAGIYWINHIFTLSGKLAKILNSDCAYTCTEVPVNLAWKIATDFVKEAFQNRFDEVIHLHTESATNILEPYYTSCQDRVSGWFCYMIWDYSFFLLDKKNYEITIIDITDND